MIATPSGVRVRKPRVHVPEHLIYEIMDGKPLYYKGYREVLAGTKTFGEIRGSSTLKSFVAAYITLLLVKNLDETYFTILTGKVGLHLNKHNNLAGDILIFDNATLPIESINELYADVPPKIVIEVDITIDPADLDHDSYIFRKTQKLLNFGVEKVIWITTQTKKVTVATLHEDRDGGPVAGKSWHKDVEILDGIRFNIGAYLTKKGSPYA